MDERRNVAGDDDIQRIRRDSEDENFRRQVSRNERQRERVERSHGNSRNRFQRQQHRKTVGEWQHDRGRRKNRA